MDGFAWFMDPAIAESADEYDALAQLMPPHARYALLIICMYSLMCFLLSLCSTAEDGIEFSRHFLSDVLEQLRPQWPSERVFVMSYGQSQVALALACQHKV